MEGNQQVVARWMRSLIALSQEIAKFTQDRLQEDAAAWSALAACRTPDEAMECQRRFTAKATQQYYDEISKLSEMMTSAAAEGFSSLQQRPSHGA
jgi:phasin family protein